MLDRNSTTLIIVDVQGKLSQAMFEKDKLVEQLRRLIRGAGALDVPILCTEQVPTALGPTITEVSEVMQGVSPIAKHSFSCCGSTAFNDTLKQLARPQVLLAGIETHVCIYQTAAELAEAGFEVAVVADAVSSRTEANKQIGLAKCRDAGAGITSVETALFELLRTAEDAHFKTIIGLVK